MTTKRWNTDNIPDQTGRVAIITGANSGIGFEAALALAEKNARVILAVRNADKGEAAATAIRRSHPAADTRVETLDLTSVDAIRAFATRVADREQRLDLLINNAGVMMTPPGRTADGFELQFGTNHLGHFALSALLFDLVAKTPHSRIVTVSSLAHRMGKLDFDDLNWQTRPYDKNQAYADSKIANLLFTWELGRRLKNAEYMTLATAAHPGFAATNLQAHTVYRFLNPIVAQKANRGALPTLRAAVDPDADYGDCYGPDGLMEMRGFAKKVTPTPAARDSETATRLWQVSEELTGVAFPLG